MKNFEKSNGVYKARLSCLFKRIKRLYNLYERFVIMYIPFITSIMYGICMFIYYFDINSRYYNSYNADVVGHSFLWLQTVLSRSRNMCKWYKASIVTLMFTHLVNIIYYHGLIKLATYINTSIAIAITSTVFWLIFRITYKTSKAIHSACTRLEQE